MGAFMVVSRPRGRRAEYTKHRSAPRAAAPCDSTAGRGEAERLGRRSDRHPRAELRYSLNAAALGSDYY
jgi:hypothetical protein